jgi:hypothetical protein
MHFGSQSSELIHNTVPAFCRRLIRFVMSRTAHCCRSPPLPDAAVRPFIAAIRAERSILSAQTWVCAAKTSIRCAAEPAQILAGFFTLVLSRLRSGLPTHLCSRSFKSHALADSTCLLLIDNLAQMLTAYGTTSHVS